MFKFDYKRYLKLILIIQNIYMDNHLQSQPLNLSAGGPRTALANPCIILSTLVIYTTSIYVNIYSELWGIGNLG
jgi:hypothetical protein